MIQHLEHLPQEDIGSLVVEMVGVMFLPYHLADHMVVVDTLFLQVAPLIKEEKEWQTLVVVDQEILVAVLVVLVLL